MGASAVAGLGSVAIGTAAALNPGTIESGPILCPFRLMTGLPCPGCGLTRSWVYVAHGDWTDAVGANPFGVVTFAVTAAVVLGVAVAALRRRPIPQLRSFTQTRAARLGVWAWLAFGVVRLTVVGASP